MCLALCADNSSLIDISVFGEYVFLELVNGQPKAREVYDIVFTPDWDDDGKTHDVLLLAISPHQLVKDGALAVRSSPAPGAGGDDDLFYDRPFGSGAKFDDQTGRFVGAFNTVDRHTRPVESEFSGLVVEPSINLLPEAQKNNGPVIMEDIGTIFEVRLPSLRAGIEYAIRLVVEPAQLLGVSGPRPLADPFPSGSPIVKWSRPMNIICPATCHQIVCDLLDEAAQEPEFAVDAKAIRHRVVKDSLHILPAELHRIGLLLPANCEMEDDDPVGCVWRSDSHGLKDGRLATEWLGGTKHYPNDDIRTMAKNCWNYLAATSGADPKPIEFLTTALGVKHTNCAAVVEGLARSGAVENTDSRRGLYRTAGFTPDQQTKAFRIVASDPVVRKQFLWVGYDVNYFIRYTYVGIAAEIFFRKRMFRENLTFWLAVAGVIIALLALIFALVPLI